MNFWQRLLTPCDIPIVFMTLQKYFALIFIIIKAALSNSA